MAHASGRFYEEEELAIIRRFYTGGTFVDVGANVGNHSVYAALALNAPKVISFEPGPLAGKLFDINILLNNLAGTVERHAVGLSKSAGTAKIGFAQLHNLGSTQLERAEGGGLVLMRGDDMLNGAEVGLIKIDTEGMEMEVLDGLSETVAAHRPALFVEVGTESDGEFRQLLGRHNYKIAETFTRYEGQRNYLALPS
jgi:FkbM family methyltransferase